jgi:hypothetical protein
LKRKVSLAKENLESGRATRNKIRENVLKRLGYEKLVVLTNINIVS